MQQPINVRVQKSGLAQAVAEMYAIKKLIAFTFAVLLCVLLGIALILLYLAKIDLLSSAIRLSHLLAGMGLTGVVVIAFLWKLIGKAIDAYIQWFVRKYVSFS